MDKQNLKELSAMTALNHMMQESHFSICTIDKVALIMEITSIRGSEAYNMLSALHCINYAKMPKELRDEIPSLIQEVLGITPSFQFRSLRKEMIDLNPTQKDDRNVIQRIFRIAN